MKPRLFAVLGLIASMSLFLPTGRTPTAAREGGADEALASFVRYNIDNSFYVSHVYPADIDSDNDVDVILIYVVVQLV